MLDDGHGFGLRVTVARRATLAAVTGVFQARQVARVAAHDRAHAHADAGLVHHVEHLRQAPARFAHEFTDGFAAFAEVEQRVGGAPVPEFVVQACQDDVVALFFLALAHAAVGIDAVARHQKQRDALDARRSTLDTGEDEVDDIFREFVLAARNPHLGAGDGVRAVVAQRGRGRDVGQPRPRLRLGKRHRAEPAAFEQRQQIFFLLLGAAELALQVGVADGQEGVARGAGVGRLKVGLYRLHHHPGQLQPAEFLVVVSREKPSVAEGLDRLLRLGHQLDLAVYNMRLVHVGGAGVVGEILLGHVVGDVEHVLIHLARVLGEAGALGQLGGVEHLEQLKLQVAFIQKRSHQDQPPEGKKGTGTGNSGKRSRQKNVRQRLLCTLALL